MSLKPFTVSIPETRISELKRKLEYATLPQPMEETSWESGTPHTDVQRLVEYWKTSFDWRKVEREINKLPNYTTRIEIAGFEAVDIHFVHQRSTVEDAIPLIFVHGCKEPFEQMPNSQCRR